MSPLCDQIPGPGDERFWREFAAKVAGRRIPFSGSLALTHRCNLGCVHCYARGEAHDAASRELNAGQWKEIIDQLKAAGCLYLLLTGGEPLLHDDFREIYAYARKNGFLVTVFTNGTLVDDRILDLFMELPPRLVEISLYGARAGTHDRVTGVPGSFSAALSVFDRLMARGIKVSLKSVLLTLNADDMPALEKLARSRGVQFRLDAAVFPSLEGDRSPLGLRVSPERAVDLEMADPERIKEWREFLAAFGQMPGGSGMFNCGSGVNTFHVDPQGWMYPCLMVRKPRYSLVRGSFQEGWNRAFSAFRNEAPAAEPCRTCEQKLLCGYCPGFFELENNDPSIPSEYLCAIGKLRFAAITRDAAEDR
jgi:radical SAM protein with 4Fe4S-binding SPASM domain